MERRCHSRLHRIANEGASYSASKLTTSNADSLGQSVLRIRKLSCDSYGLTRCLQEIQLNVDQTSKLLPVH